VPVFALPRTGLPSSSVTSLPPFLNLFPFLGSDAALFLRFFFWPYKSPRAFNGSALCRTILCFLRLAFPSFLSLRNLVLFFFCRQFFGFCGISFSLGLRNFLRRLFFFSEGFSQLAPVCLCLPFPLEVTLHRENFLPLLFFFALSRLAFIVRGNLRATFFLAFFFLFIFGLRLFSLGVCLPLNIFLYATDLL